MLSDWVHLLMSTPYGKKKKMLQMRGMKIRDERHRKEKKNETRRKYS